MIANIFSSHRPININMVMGIWKIWGISISIIFLFGVSWIDVISERIGGGRGFYFMDKSQGGLGSWIGKLLCCTCVCVRYFSVIAVNLKGDNKAMVEIGIYSRVIHGVYLGRGTARIGSARGARGLGRYAYGTARGS